MKRQNFRSRRWQLRHHRRPSISAVRRQAHQLSPLEVVRLRRRSRLKGKRASLQEERVLVEGARTALLRSRPADALRPARKHRTRFPNGQIAKDRDFIIATALSKLGRSSEAQASASFGNYSFQRTSIVSEFVAPGLAQHSPRIADGAGAFREHALATSLRYIKAHRIIGCGNFVAALVECKTAGSTNAVIDLFRIEEGTIAEHWDVSEPINPPDTWVNSGKF